MSWTVGNRGIVQVREVSHSCGVREPVSILFLSDLHFSKSSQLIADQILAHAMRLSPDLILLGGDYVDFKSGLPVMDKFLRELQQIAPCIAILGNHDFWFYKKRILELFSSHQVPVLGEKGLNRYQEHGLQIDAIPHKEGGDVLLQHEPKQLDAVLHQYKLILAGHLHGGQIVLWATEKGWYPGRLFYKWNRSSLAKDSAIAIVSRGLGDTFPLRYNCPKELIYVKLSQ